MPEQNTSATAAPQRENMLVNLLFNIVIPVIVLSKLSGEAYLGARWGIVVALSFPIAYGVKDYFRAKKVNFFSVIGVISVFLTGGMALLELPPQYIAIKEAAIPAFFGIAILVSLKTPYPLVKTLIYNDTILNVERIESELSARDNKPAFDRALVNASWMLVGSFALSSVLNYVLATVLLVAEPGTEAFNAQLGKMTALSFPFIALPATLVTMGALFYLFRRILKLTTLELNDIVNAA